jgi:hypothetical protein
VPSIELLRWELLEQFDPWGQARQDWYHAHLVSAVYVSGKVVDKATENPIPLNECLPKFADPWPDTPFEDDPEPTFYQTAPGVERSLDMYMAASNAEWKRKRGL